VNEKINAKNFLVIPQNKEITNLELIEKIYKISC